jgi:glycosyltransferase involved in cell wall biosynthesis
VLSRVLGGRFRLLLNRGVLYRPNPLIGVFAAIADGVVCNSHASAAVLKACGTPARRVNVIYNSFAAPLSAGPREPDGTLRVIYVGNGKPVKGFDVFLRAAEEYARHYPDSPVTFVSYGIERDAAIAGCCGQDGLDRIELHPTASHDEVLRALTGADVLALTSRMESLPNVVLEAFSRSLPVVCTNVGGVVELVQDGVNGWLCQSEDSRTIADRLHDLTERPQQRLAMGTFNCEVVRTRFNNSRKGYLLLRVYSGERVVDAAGWAGDARIPTCAT